MYMSFQEKYLKYKNKYLSLKNKLNSTHYGAGGELVLEPSEFGIHNLIAEIFKVKRTGSSEENIYKDSTMNVIKNDPTFQYIINDLL